MPQENMFSGVDAVPIGRRMVDIISGHIGPAHNERAEEARRLGLAFVVEYESPGLQDAATTLVARRKALDDVLGRLLGGTGDHAVVVGARLYTFDHLFPFLNPAMLARHGANLMRFCHLRIPGISFDDLDRLLKPIKRNSYDFAYDMRDQLNIVASDGRHGVGAGDPGPQVVQVVPDKPFDFSYSCHHEDQGDRNAQFGWEIAALELEDAWGLEPPETGKALGDGIIIGHPDTGYSDHPALPSTSSKLLRDKGDNPADGGTDAKDDLKPTMFNSEPGHGTMTGSLIVAGSENQPIKATLPIGGVVGCAPRAKLVPIRVCDCTAFVENANVAKGIVWAVQQGCHMISISVGGFFIPGIHDALKAAYDADMVVIAAAGNCEPFVVSPACFNTCFAVGASDADSKYWAYAAYGPKVAIAAPGVVVRSTLINNNVNPYTYDYNTGSGCSFSTAFAAGACALWLGYFGRDYLRGLHKGKLQDVFTKAARKSATPPPQDWDTQQWGAGILNVRKLLEFDPSTLAYTAPANDVVDEVDTFLKFMAWLLQKSENAGDIIPTLMGWFGVESEDAVRAILEEHGWEMVNGLIERGFHGIEGEGAGVLNYLKSVASYALGSLFK